MKKYLLMLLGISTAWVGYGQIDYARSNLHYLDITNHTVPGQWISSGSNATITVSGTGIYYFTIGAATTAIPHTTISVAINNLTPMNSTLTAGQTYVQSPQFQLFGGPIGTNSIDIQANFSGPYLPCASAGYTISIFTISHQLVYTQDVYVSTIAPNALHFKPTALEVDHKGFWNYEKVVAAQSITIHPGVHIEPYASATGAPRREFKIGACAYKQGLTSIPDGEQEQSFNASLEQLTVKPTIDLTATVGPENLQVSLVNSPGPVDIELYSIEGRQVLSQRIDPGSNLISTGHLNSGVYILSSRQRGLNVSEKILIQH